MDKNKKLAEIEMYLCKDTEQKQKSLPTKINTRGWHDVAVSVTW
jgi:hypothetical protein